MSVAYIPTTSHAQGSDVTQVTRGPQTKSVVNLSASVPPEWYGMVFIIHLLSLEGKEIPSDLGKTHVIVPSEIIQGRLKRVLADISRQIENIIQGKRGIF